MILRPDIVDLKYELETLDTSMNTYVHTTSHTVPLNNNQSHLTLGMIAQDRLDVRDSIKLMEFQVGTTTLWHL